jgi:hypothetical protein
VPESGTLIVFGTALDEEITSAAVLPPAADGVKVICTVQLFWPTTLLSVVPQVVALQTVAPQEKLAAELPLIWKPEMLSRAPPVLVTVSVCGALAKPICCPAKVRLDGLTLKAGGAIPVPLRATVCVCNSS